MHIDKSRRVFAALYHSYVDTSSGAAVCLREMLERLAGRGWQVRVLSGPMLDFVNAVAEVLGKEFPDISFGTLAYFDTQALPKTIRPRKNVIWSKGNSGSSRDRLPRTACSRWSGSIAWERVPSAPWSCWTASTIRR